jgi:hypothetical protein
MKSDDDLPRQARNKHKEINDKDRRKKKQKGALGAVFFAYAALTAQSPRPKETPPFLKCFPYVCPEPVLVK